MGAVALFFCLFCLGYFDAFFASYVQVAEYPVGITSRGGGPVNLGTGGLLDFLVKKGQGCTAG